MPKASVHADDPHYTQRGGWLRAAVLGGNDGIISVASLIIGVAAAGPGPSVVLVSAIAALTAGAMSMAAGEYISVSSQRDSERADIEREKRAIEETPEAELEELTAIYADRGLQPHTAAIVARELMATDPLGAHLRDEVGLIDTMRARPLQAAMASGATFSAAAALPVVTAFLVPTAWIIPGVVAVALLALALLGALGARIGGAAMLPAIIRVVGWGAFAMAGTALIGALFGVTV
jgi:VIT1/CCC1 family predicted Fe2+/Mn2+ transporter